MRPSTVREKLARNTRTYELAAREISHRIEVLQDDVLRAQRDALGCLQNLAAQQLETAAGGNVNDTSLVAGYGDALARREAAEADLRDQLAKTESQIASHVAKIATLNEKAETAQADFNTRVSEDPACRDAIERHANAVARRSHFAGQLDEIQQECRSKLAGYEIDARYQYLKHRGFGGADYSATGLPRMLDRALAKQCNYTENRQNEDLLVLMDQESLAIAAQLDDEVAEAEKEAEKRRNAASESSGLQAIEDALAQEHARVKALKQVANTKHDALHAFATRTDPHYQQIQKQLATHLGNRSLDELMELARRTPTQTDDEQVERLTTLHTRIRDNKQTMKALGPDLQHAQDQYDRAKKAERQFSRQSYSDSRYEYRSGLDLDALLLGYMAGQMSDTQLTHEVDQYRREQPSHSSSSSWGSSSSSRSDDFGFGSSTFSSSDSLGGGGFSTSDGF